MAVGAGPRRVTGVVCVQKIDPADDLPHPLDRAAERLTGGVSVAGVEAEADLGVPRGLRHRFPEQGERVEAAGYCVVAAGGVLDQHRDLRFEHLQGADPAAHAGFDAVLGVAPMNDHRRRG